MAEIAAGALVAEQVVSTGLEAGAAVSIAKPTQPLKATLSQIATSSPDDSSLALARSHHTVTTINDKTYIFGGLHKPGTLCTTDVHAISLPNPKANANAKAGDADLQQQQQTYACYPAFPLKDTATNTLLVPAPRHSHAAAARPSPGQDNNTTAHLVIHGGLDAHNKPINEDNGCLWLFDTDTLRWSRLAPADPTASYPSPHAAANHLIVFPDAKDPNTLLLHDGGGSNDGPETWIFDLTALRWTQLPSAPASSSSTAAFVDGALYTINNSSSGLSGAIHVLRYPGSPQNINNAPPAREQQEQEQHNYKWETIDFQTNPLAAPGPKAREGPSASLIAVSTGYGRHYLVYMFGRAPGSASETTTQQPLCSDVWALQVPSHGFNPAAVKDVIRDKVLPSSVESGAYSWAEVEILPTEQVASEGKVHPGPRAYVGASGCLDGKGVVFWGGENAGGQRESDGWLLKIQ